MNSLLIGCLVAPWLVAVYGGSIAAHGYATRAKAGRGQRTCLVWLTTLAGFVLFGLLLVAFAVPWLARPCAQTATTTFGLAVVALAATAFLVLSLEDTITLLAAPPDFRRFVLFAVAALAAQAITLLVLIGYNVVQAGRCV